MIFKKRQCEAHWARSTHLSVSVSNVWRSEGQPRNEFLSQIEAYPPTGVGNHDN